ncbi:MAG TPA: hypothetical protein VGH19_12195 [Verrucomicrobiae bacterium]
MEAETLERIENEARAKMTWGESPESVMTYIQLQGVEAADALVMMDSLKKERAANVRAEGIRKICIGSAMIAAPIAYLIVSLVIGVVLMKLMAVLILLGLWGVWKVIGGCINIFAPNFGNEDLSQ